MTKKYILKTGKHQFAPGSAPIHDNDSLTDDEIEWYLERYPHIASLFATQLTEEETLASNAKEMKIRNKFTKNKNTREGSSLTPPSGGREAI